MYIVTTREAKYLAKLVSEDIAERQELLHSSSDAVPVHVLIINPLNPVFSSLVGESCSSRQRSSGTPAEALLVALLRKPWQLHTRTKYM